VQLSQIVTDLKDHFEHSKANAETFLEQHLPALAGLAEHAAANPLIDAALAAVHLSPSMLQALADVIGKAETELAALQPAPAAPESAEPDNLNVAA